MTTGKYRQLSLEGVKTSSIKNRESKVSRPRSGTPRNCRSSLDDWLDSLPDILRGRDFKTFVRESRRALSRELSFIVMMGAHPVKCGLSPILIRLLRERPVSHLALNGAAAIHDVELALYGQTSENVGPGLDDGSFGMCRETADFLNSSLTEEGLESHGFGESLARKLDQCAPEQRRESIVWQAWKQGIPVTLHSALGTEIVHQHPSLDGEAHGRKNLADFRIFAHSLSHLKTGGILLNIGSAVILPEVFLKTLTVVRNLGHAAFGFHTAVFDMNHHYRPRENVQQRPTRKGGHGYYFIGHFEIMLSLYLTLLLD